MIAQPVGASSAAVHPARLVSQATGHRADEERHRAATEAELKQAVAAANRIVRALDNTLEFSVVDMTTGETVVRVVDTASGELIRQIPSEEMMAIADALDRLQGMLLNNEA